MKVFPFRQNSVSFMLRQSWTISKSRSLFPLESDLSTIENDSIPRTGFPELPKSVSCQGISTLEDAGCCWLPLAAACRKSETPKRLALTSRSWVNSGEVNCSTSKVSAISDAATVVARSLTSVLKLFFLEEMSIGVCSLLTSMRLLGS